MAEIKNEGNCFICGKTLPKAAARNHVLREHAAGDEDCALLRVEGDNKDYWLYADVAKERTLTELDAFLRGIWLECCGHLSGFRAADGVTIRQVKKFGEFGVGDKFIFDYDLGTTTECHIAVVGETKRPAQKKGARLLIRNVPPVFNCSGCDKRAEYICVECSGTGKYPYLCLRCAKKHAHERISKTANSPRSGVCAYDGALDTYFFDPGKY